MVLFDKEKLAEQLRALGELPQIKEVKALRQRLEKELERLGEKESIAEEVSKSTRGQKISQALKNHFRYLRLIRNNFPDIKWNDLRKEYSKKRKGEESNIPDFIWQNPSP
jgi:hypothetical protein